MLAVAYLVGKSQDSTDEASAEPMKDDTATVAYLGGKNKDSMNGASVGVCEKGQQWPAAVALAAKSEAAGRCAALPAGQSDGRRP